MLLSNDWERQASPVEQKVVDKAGIAALQLERQMLYNCLYLGVSLYNQKLRNCCADYALYFVRVDEFAS